VPAAGVRVDILGEDASGQLVVLASVFTDGVGRYVAMVKPGARSAEADIDGAICSGPEQITVVSGQETVVDFACFAIAGTYIATFTETSNTCGTPLQSGFGVTLTVEYQNTAGERIKLLPSDRPVETTASGDYDPATRTASAMSPPFEAGGITFQEFWAFVIGLSGVGVTFDGTIDVTLSVGSAGCQRTFDLDATRTGT
jgi:hypothetical protein